MTFNYNNKHNRPYDHKIDEDKGAQEFAPLMESDEFFLRESELDVERDLAMAQSDRFFSSYEPEADEISGEWMR